MFKTRNVRTFSARFISEMDLFIVQLFGCCKKNPTKIEWENEMKQPIKRECSEFVLSLGE